MIRTNIILLLLILIFQSPASAVQTKSKNEKPHPALTDPRKATEKSPEQFRVKVISTKGDFEITVTRKWSPNGADRFYNLVRIGYFQDIAIFRAIRGFMFQFGIHGDPKISAKWSEATFKDDRAAGISNRKGFITFAKSSLPNSRSTQFFINLGNNSNLDDMGFTPFGQVTKGLSVIDKINTEYGENRSGVQGNFTAKGNDYIKKQFPRIDFIKSITLIKEK